MAVRRSPAEWYMLLCLALLLLAFWFGGNYTTRAHATFAGGWSAGLSYWGGTGVVLGMLIGLLSVAIGYAHRTSGEVGLLLAGFLLISGLNLVCLRYIVDGMNVQFDDSDAVRLRTQVLQVTPGTGRQRGTLELHDWRGGKPLYASHDARVFRLDMDNRHADFYLRQGFFGMPYADEYPSGS